MPVIPIPVSPRKVRRFGSEERRPIRLVADFMIETIVIKNRVSRRTYWPRCTQRPERVLQAGPLRSSNGNEIIVVKQDGDQFFESFHGDGFDRIDREVL